MEFGDVGAYRMLKGEAVVFVDPASIPESAIDDLDKAPLEDGRIRVRTDLHILTPADFARGSRRMMYDFGNRGNKRALRAYNDGVISNDPRTAAHAGNGFLMR